MAPVWKNDGVTQPMCRLVGLSAPERPSCWKVAERRALCSLCRGEHPLGARLVNHVCAHEDCELEQPYSSRLRALAAGQLLEVQRNS